MAEHGISRRRFMGYLIAAPTLVAGAQLLGPGLASWDVSLLKNTTIHERLNLQFRAELFSVLNRANFNSPNAVVFTPSGVSPTAGVVTSTSTTSRQIQFGLKLLW